MSTRNIYLLDTCVCIALLKKSPSVIQRLREVGTSNCRISDITLAELYFGAFKSGKEKHFNDVSKISKLFEKFPIQYTRKYGEIRWELEKQGLRIGDRLNRSLGMNLVLFLQFLLCHFHPNLGFVSCFLRPFHS